ncbi:MAG: hypothetical protein ACFFC7_20180 [Candidatus Hermodarchaeota archaeon]
MGCNISIIGKNGDELEESRDIYFNYLRNPFGFHQFILHNIRIDIRKYPLFPYEEDYKNIYPGRFRKIWMLRTAKEILNKISSMATLELKFKKSTYALFKHQYSFTNRKFPIYERILCPYCGTIGIIEQKKCLVCGNLVLGYASHSGEIVIIKLPRRSEIDSNDLDSSHMTHERYVEWTIQFLELITLLCRKNNGFYVSS